MLKNFHYRNFILPFKPLDIPIYSFAKKASISEANVKETVPTGTYTGTAEEIARKCMRNARHDKKKAMKRITFYINRAGRNCSPEVLRAKEMIRYSRNFSSYGCPNLGSYYFNRVMPNPSMPRDSSTVSRGGVVNNTVMVPIVSRNQEVLFDTLSSYPPEIQICMAEYFLEQSIAAVEAYYWTNGFFSNPMDHVTWLARWADILSRKANIDYVTRFMSHLQNQKYL